MGIFTISIIAVAILTLGIIYAILRKTNSQKNHFRNPIFWVSTIVATPIVYAGLLFIWYKVSSSYPERTFNKFEWLENEEKRYEYADDLLNHDKLNGLTKSEVIEMLGKASHENDSTLTYYIGYSPKIFMNSVPDWIEIEFENEIVESLRIIP